MRARHCQVHRVKGASPGRFEPVSEETKAREEARGWRGKAAMAQPTTPPHSITASTLETTPAPALQELEDE